MNPDEFIEYWEGTYSPSCLFEKKDDDDLYRECEIGRDSMRKL